MQGRLKLLRDSLTVLASPPHVQLQHLTNLGVPGVVDELALEYDDTATAVDTMFAEGELDHRQRDCVKKLNQFMRQFSGHANADLWTPEALRSTQQWKQVRSMANECLELLKRLPSADR